MKVLRVRVQCFQGIESADIEFGPGLNILYGPNDLGKTSIASAVRAALLLRASAKAGDAHAPWHRDASPEVELTLKTDDDRVWRVRKVFNSTGSGWAELSESNDGQTFRVDASGREAEGKLQRMLRWGIPEPGGKRGASGIPVSFLSSVLLADQANVGDILTKSLADDPDESGRLRLNEALQALAQDPQLKAALDRAQQEVDRFYSATGKKRRGQSSPFTTVANEVKELQADERRLREVVDKASAAEREVESLRDQVREQTDRVDEARDALDLASKRAEQHVAVLAAEQALAAARADLLAVAELEQRADKKAEEIRTCRERLAEAEVQAADEAAKLEAVEAHRDEARARLDRAQGGEVEQARQLELARLDKQSLEIEARQRACESNLEAVSGALLATRDLEAAREAEGLLATKVNELRTNLQEASAAAGDAEDDLKLARGRRAGLRWRNSLDALEQAREAARRAEDFTNRAARLGEEAARDRSRIAAGPELPSHDGIRSLKDLEAELRIAETSLALGLAVEVKPRRELTLSARKDDEPEPTPHHMTDGESIAIEGNKLIELAVSDLMDITVTAGSADARANAAKLRSRWEAEARPILETVGATNVDALVQLREERDQLEATAAQKEREASELASKADGERAHAAEASTHEDAVRDHEAELDAWDRQQVLAALAENGDTTEREAEQQVSVAEARRDEARDGKTTAKGALDGAIADLERQQATVAALTEARNTAVKRVAAFAPPGARVDAPHALSALQKQFDATSESLTTELDEVRARRERTERAAVEGVVELQDAVEAAEQAVKEAKKRLQDATTATTEARNACVRAETGHSDLLEQVAAADSASKQTLCDQREAALQLLPRPKPPCCDGEVETARRTFDEEQAALSEIKARLAEQTGALKTTGGPGARIELDEVCEAIKKAKRREAEVEIEGKAWQLLAETLKDTERSEGVHLGRALAPQVKDRFAELTNGRYHDVHLSPALVTDNVSMPGLTTGNRIVDALSLGTREQLATLLRVAIAEQLGFVVFLDDHLVQADPQRLEWFCSLLRKAAVKVQVVVLTCRAGDYVPTTDLPTATGAASRDLAGGNIRVVDLERIVTRWRPEAGQ